MALRTTTDPVMKLVRAERTQLFTYEEWTCARLFWLGTGQRLGPLVALFQSDAGALEEPGITALREMLDLVSERMLGRELNANVQHSGAAGGEFFELVKKTWKLPYRHVTDSTDTVRIGAKKIADYGASEAPRVPTLGEIPLFRSALDKLIGLVADESGPLSFEAIGPRYLKDRTR